MAVNNMTKEQAYQLIAAIHAQATGTAVLTPTNLSDFISVAQSTLAAGYEQTLNAITQVLSRTIVAVRPYDEKFKGLEMTAEGDKADVKIVDAQRAEKFFVCAVADLGVGG